MSPEVTVAAPPSTLLTLLWFSWNSRRPPGDISHHVTRRSCAWELKIKYNKIKTCFRRLWAGTLSSTSQGRPHKLRLALIICRRQPIGSRQSTIDGVLCLLAPHYPSTVPAHCLAAGARLSSDGPTCSQSRNRWLWRARTCGRAAAGKRHIPTAYDIRCDVAWTAKKNVKGKKTTKNCWSWPGLTRQTRDLNFYLIYFNTFNIYPQSPCMIAIYSKAEY